MNVQGPEGILGTPGQRGHPGKKVIFILFLFILLFFFPMCPQLHRMLVISLFILAIKK
jgi:hypothetical protein